MENGNLEKQQYGDTPNICIKTIKLQAMKKE
jgi:hypothetical protein